MSQSTDPTRYIKKSRTSWHKSASTSCGKLDKMFAAAVNPFMQKTHTREVPEKREGRREAAGTDDVGLTMAG